MLRSAEVSQSRSIGSATPLLLNSRTLGRGDLATADLKDRPKNVSNEHSISGLWLSGDVVNRRTAICMPVLNKYHVPCSNTTAESMV